MSKTKKIILIVLGVIILIVLGVVLRYVLAYNGFLDKITGRKPEVKQYSVLVNNDSGLNEIADLKNKSVGFLKTDPKAVNAEQYLQNVVKVEADFYDDIDMMLDVLKNRITDAITLETDRLEMLKEESEEMIKNTKVIYTFEIELEGEDVEVSTKEITTEPFVVYISGSDSRTGIQTTARSDVNIVAVVNPGEGKILLVSIPRDTYVQLHDTTGLKDKLTHAGVYGINMSKTTIEDLLGIKIDYTIKVSFDTVVRVVDQLDGIDIESDQAMTLKAENGKVCEYVVGKQHVDGDCALRFARERKSYETGDRHRGENQQQVITSIIGRLSSSKDYLLKIPTILDIAADSFETDISRDNVSGFIRRQLTDPIKWQVKSISVDGTGTYEPTYSMGANLPLYVMLPSAESIANATNQINEYLTVAEPAEESTSED
ncbi:LCP family protein [Candidatus Saccharibacteria bacterium]|nr:LCP family protein [Candidatus Saccharibacteria bacterium]